MVWNEKRQRFDWREVRRYSYRRDEYDPILVKVTGLYSVYCGQGWEPGSRQSRDSSRLSDDPTSWSGTTRLRWSRPGARFKRQAWSDIWCRPRLCRGPAWPRTARAYIGSRAPGYRRATAHHCLPARRRTSGGARDQPSQRYPLHRTYAARSQAHSSDRVRRHGTAELDVFIVSVIATRIFSTTSGRSGSP